MTKKYRYHISFPMIVLEEEGSRLEKSQVFKSIVESLSKDSNYRQEIRSKTEITADLIDNSDEFASYQL